MQGNFKKQTNQTIKSFELEIEVHLVPAQLFIFKMEKKEKKRSIFDSPMTYFVATVPELITININTINEYFKQRSGHSKMKRISQIAMSSKESGTNNNNTQTKTQQNPLLVLNQRLKNLLVTIFFPLFVRNLTIHVFFYTTFSDEFSLSHSFSNSIYFTNKHRVF